MFSTFTNYLWGANGEEGCPNNEVNPTADPPLMAGDDMMDTKTDRPRNASIPADDDDWVVVGPNPAPGSLAGNLSPLVLSNSSSPAASDAGSEDSHHPASRPPVRAGSGRHQTLTAANNAALHQAEVGKLSRLAQAGQVKHTSKAVSSKSLKRSNKAVIQYNAGSQKKTTARHNLSIKMAGANKNLKQC